MTKEKEKKVSKDQLLLEASRLGQLHQLESILNQMQHIKSKKKTNPLASLRKTVGPNSVRDPVTGFTCLHHAALNGHSECVRLILDHGAKVNAVDYKGSSALHLAAWAGNVEVVRILLRQAHHQEHRQHSSSSPSEPLADGQQRLRQRQQHQFTGVDQQQPQPHSPNWHNQTAKSLSATSTGQLDIDLCNNDNQTPLSLAAQFGHSQVVAELLAHGASVHLRNSQLESPLDLACLNGRLETVDLLLRHSSGLAADLRRARATIPSAQNHDDVQCFSDLKARPLSMSAEAGASTRGASASGSSPSGRRQSGSSAWSTLLRGRRDSSGSGSQTQPAQQPASPLHRLTAGTLSMRQKTQPEVGNKENLAAVEFSPTGGGSGSSSAGRDRRRATLTVGALISAAISTGQQQQQSRQSSLDSGWLANQQQLPLQLDGNQLPMKDTTAPSGKQSPPLAGNSWPGERLLDHSPLHYAVRRGHSNVVTLLLGTYQANVLQITTLGSVLHEIALNNGKHSDMIGLLFSYIGNIRPTAATTAAMLLPLDSNQAARLQPNNSDNQDIGSLRSILLDKFLNLKNGQQKNVFEVLNEINNRSAQEMKRLIYEFSEQIHQKPNISSPTKTTTSFEFNNSNNNTVANLHNYQQYQALQQLQVAPVANNLSQQQRLTHKNNTQQQQQAVNCKSINLEQQPQQLYTSSQQQKAMQFSDSSMKLDSFVTMKRIPKHKLPALQAANNGNNLIPDGTQTINRRVHMGSPMDQTKSSNYGQQPLELLGQQQAAAMTRSVSNLSRGPSVAYRADLGAANGLSGPPGSVWPQQWQMSANGAGFNGKLCELDQEARRRRSRSRDLGSLLMEAQSQRDEKSSISTATGYSPQQVQAANERLYDNNGVNPLGVAQLVRSQTDCSHLVGRFFGNQTGGYSSYSLAAGGGPQPASQHQDGHQHHSSQFDASQQRQLQLQQPPYTATLDRKAINRHYHVYEHEFYPPRLLADGSQKQAVAVVQPMGLNAAAPQASSNLRASTRSSASSASAKSQPTGGARIPSAAAGFNQHSNSRLSLNIEPPPRRPDGSVVDMAQYQQQLQMDRFLNRHSRKSQVGGANAASADCRSASVDQSKQVSSIENQTSLASVAGQHLKPSAISNSISLESHLSEPHLFETTRQALLHDFDQMIGRELLNRDHRQIIEGGRLDESSTLTGVMLDMDRRGERLTVSGTLTRANARPTVGGPTSSSSTGRGPFSTSSYDNQSSPSDSLMINDRELSNQSASPMSATGSCGSNLQTSRNGRRTANNNNGNNHVEADNVAPKAPPKPPRLSLLNKSASTNSNVKHNGSSPFQGAVIYDLPSAVSARQEPPAVDTKRAQTIRGQSITPSATGQLSTKQAKASLTEPPNVRPPPLPVAANLPPLHIEPASNLGCCSSSSTGSAISGGSGIGHHQEPIGLLKMASNEMSGSNYSLVRRTAANGLAANGPKMMPTSTTVINPSQQMDPDSGVCTSNSPASMSHDSEEQEAGGEIRANPKQTEPAIVRHLARPAQRSPEVSPPSPKTAQLCIEEALMPLEKTQHQTSEAANQTNEAAENCSQSKSNRLTEALAKWFDTEQPAKGGHLEADYENCQLLQRKLQMARCQSISELLSDANNVQKDSREDQEAPILLGSVSSASSASPSQKSSTCSNSSAHTDESVEEEDYAESVPTSEDGGRSSSASSDEQQALADSVDSGSNRKEVLLKVVVDESERGSNGDEVFYMNPSELKKIAIKRSQADAGTLTDEELCAAIDKESGYIRFTLRKRRNNTAPTIDGEPKRMSMVDTQSSSNSNVMDQEAQRSSDDAMTSRCKKTRLTSTDAVNHKPTSGVNLVPAAGCSVASQAPICKLSGNLQQQAQPTAAPVSNSATVPSAQDMNNNSSSLGQKQNVSLLKSWFATHLAGLVEYSNQFIANGFDDLRFLNHPKLLNDQLLASMGFTDESHRVLIMDRISGELPELDFSKLDLMPPHGGDKKRVAMSLLGRLSLTVDLDSFTIDGVESLRNISEHLLIGHKVRLIAALDYLADQSKRQSELEFAKTSSIDNGIDMDTMDITSQPSSSSSKESIASIVSLKSICITTIDSTSKTETNQLTKEPEQPKPAREESPKHQVEPQPVERPNEETNSHAPINRWSSGSVTKVTSGGSLVGEVARKLEAVAAQKAASENPRANLKPVAAVRRINCKPQEPQDGLSNSKVNKSMELNKVDSPETQISPTKIRRTFGPVKSVCWPPKNTQQEKEVTVNREVNKLNATISTFQRRLEDTVKPPNVDGPQQLASSEVNAGNRQRPKPAPPAKPAKLAASKFNIDLSQRL